MTRRERVSADIHMTFDLIRHLIEHPDEIEQIPDQAVVQIVSSDRPMGPPTPEGVPTATFLAHHSFRRVKTAA